MPPRSSRLGPALVLAALSLCVACATPRHWPAEPLPAERTVVPPRDPRLVTLGATAMKSDRGLLVARRALGFDSLPSTSSEPRPVSWLRRPARRRETDWSAAVVFLAYALGAATGTSPHIASAGGACAN